MNIRRNIQQAVISEPTIITKAQAIRVIEALVLCYGTQSFSAIGVLAHRTFFSFRDISQFMHDELQAGVKAALSKAVETPLTDVIPGALYHEVKRVFGSVRGPVNFKIDNGPYCQFDPYTQP